MSFVVLHMEKAHGSNSGTTAHIERFIIPKNADNLKAEVVDLQQQKETAREELRRAKKRNTDREAERGGNHRSRQHRRERRFSFRQ